MLDANKEEYRKALIYGWPALFSDCRIDPDTVPVGLYHYELRHGDDEDYPVQMSESIRVNFFGTILSDANLLLDDRELDIVCKNPDYYFDDFILYVSDESPTLADYLKDKEQ